MADNSKIEWTDATWNPITGCSVLTPGCTNCYAMKLAGTRLRNHPSRAGLTVESKAGPVWNGKVRFNEEWLTQPLHWKKPRMVFVCAHGDLFHENVPDEWLDKVFAVMALAPQHTFQVLTKRAKRMREYMADPDRKRAIASHAMPISCLLARDGGHKARIKLDHFSACFAGSGPFPNVWLGISAERQPEADERIPDLLATPAAVRFVSLEPLLGQIDLTGLAFPKTCECEHHSPTLNALEATVLCEGCCEGPERMDLGKLDWVIVGGESGDGARPMHPDWVRSLRDQCAEADVAFFFKQWGAWSEFYDRDRDDPDWRNVPQVDHQMGRGAERWHNLAGGIGFHGERLVAMRNVGKGAAGRLLDGAEHNGMPERA